MFEIQEVVSLNDELNSSLNKNQIALLKWIYLGLGINECREKFGDSGYLFSNMIAKFISSSNEYNISKKALQKIIEKGIDLEKVYKRSYFSKLTEFYYEHPIPVSIIREKLLLNNFDISQIANILSSCGPLVIILKEENDLLDKAKLKSKMPKEWKFGDNTFARYKKLGIEISNKKIKVSGSIIR